MVHDSEEIGPWTLLAGDPKPELLIVGQDWGDVNYFRVNGGRDRVDNPTTRTLASLLRSIGFPLKLDGTDPPSSGVFLTNVILCLKAGGMQAKIRQDWGSHCSQRFLVPLVEALRPKVVVTLGAAAYRATAIAFGHRPAELRKAVESPDPTHLSGRTVLMPVYHCGRRVLNTHRKIDSQINDWKRVGKYLGRPLQAVEF